MVTKKEGLMIAELINKMNSTRACADSFKDSNKYLNSSFFLDHLKVELELAEKFNVNTFSNMSLKDRIKELRDCIPSIEHYVESLNEKAV